MDMEFRFWDNNLKCWTIIVGTVGIENRNFKILYLNPKSSERNVTITQAIGHKDIEDKKIFVGDWVEVMDDKNIKDLYLISHSGEKLFARRCMIDYRCYCEDCIDEDKQRNCWTYEDLDIYYALHNPKIVGNEFENPFLYMER